jgi:hypothetical protein
VTQALCNYGFQQRQTIWKDNIFHFAKSNCYVAFLRLRKKTFFPLSTDFLQDGNSDYAHAQQREAFFSVKTKISQCYFDSHCPVRKIKNNILYSNQK